MQVSELVSNLEKVAEYYHSKGDQGRKIAFIKAANKIRHTFSTSEEVNDNYDFTVLDGISHGIQSRIEKIIRGEFLEELTPSAEGVLLFNSLHPIVRNNLAAFGIRNDAAIKAAMYDPEKCHILPDSVIKSLGRVRRTAAITMVAYFKEAIQNTKKDIYIVGSWRRNSPTIKDLDFLVIADSDLEAEETIQKLLNTLELPYVKTNKGEVMRTFKFACNGLVLDAQFKVVPKVSFGTGMLHFTGPSKSNIFTRAEVKAKGLTLNEYGLFNKVGENLVSGYNEAKVIETLSSYGVYVPTDPTKR